MPTHSTLKKIPCQEKQMKNKTSKNSLLSSISFFSLFINKFVFNLGVI
jgi:hypothetical protein